MAKPKKIRKVKKSIKKAIKRTAKVLDVKGKVDCSQLSKKQRRKLGSQFCL